MLLSVTTLPPAVAANTPDPTSLPALSYTRHRPCSPPFSSRNRFRTDADTDSTLSPKSKITSSDTDHCGAYPICATVPDGDATPFTP